MNLTLESAIDRYLLFHDLTPETAAWYKRVISVYRTWAGGDVPLDKFCGDSISQLLKDKRDVGRSPSYVKSLRNGLVAVLRDIRGQGPIERVRSVKVPPLEPTGWTRAEVERLIHDGCRDLPPAFRVRWQSFIAAGYYSGLDACDLERIEPDHIRPDGVIVWRRKKTGSRVIVRFPPPLLDMIRSFAAAEGPIWQRPYSKEWRRKVFKGIVQRAGLTGTFKKLRKTSGSAVEAECPGSGHKHLGNTRAIFERHYEVHGLTRMEPTMPVEIRLTDSVGEESV
jgi:integrase